MTEPADETKGGDSTPLTAARVAALATEGLNELSSVDVDAVVAVDYDDQGWIVTLQAVEMHRIPPSTDVLADYVVHLNGSGELLRFHRQDRYLRGAASTRHAP